MPQHKSCKKRVLTNLKAQERNRASRSTLRRAIRAYRQEEQPDPAAAFNVLQSLLDKAVNKGIISKNKAARLKSRQAPTA